MRIVKLSELPAVELRDNLLEYIPDSRVYRCYLMDRYHWRKVHEHYYLQKLDLWLNEGSIRYHAFLASSLRTMLRYTADSRCIPLERPDIILMMPSQVAPPPRL